MQKTTSSCGPRSGIHRLFLVEQPAGCAGCGLEARAPWLWRAARRLRRMRAGSPRTLALASSPPVAPDAGWKPAHPAEGLRSLAMSSRSPVAPHAGRRPAHPGNSGRMLQDSDAKSIQIGRRNASRAFPPQQNNDWQFGRSFLSPQNLQLAAQVGDTHIRQRTTYCYHND